MHIPSHALWKFAIHAFFPSCIFVCFFFLSFLPPCIHMSALFSCVVFVMISMFSHLLHVILAFVFKWTRPKFGTITTIVMEFCASFHWKSFVIMFKEHLRFPKRIFRQECRNGSTDDVQAIISFYAIKKRKRPSRKTSYCIVSFFSKLNHNTMSAW